MVEYINKKWKIDDNENGDAIMTCNINYNNQAWAAVTKTNFILSYGQLTNISIDIKNMAESQKKVINFIQNTLNDNTDESVIEIKQRFEIVSNHFFTIGMKYYETAQDICYFGGNKELALPIKKIIESYEKRLTLLKDRVINVGTSVDRLKYLIDLIDWLGDAPASFALRLKQFKISVNVHEQPGSFLLNTYQSTISSDQCTALNIYWKRGGAYGC